MPATLIDLCASNLIYLIINAVSGVILDIIGYPAGTTEPFLSMMLRSGFFFYASLKASFFERNQLFLKNL